MDHETGKGRLLYRISSVYFLELESTSEGVEGGRVLMVIMRSCCGNFKTQRSNCVVKCRYIRALRSRAWRQIREFSTLLLLFMVLDFVGKEWCFQNLRKETLGEDISDLTRPPFAKVFTFFGR